MELKYGLVSVDDHVLEHPSVWKDRMAARWGEDIPHVVDNDDGSQSWLVGGQRLPLTGAGSIGAVLGDRAAAPQRWDDVPAVAYVPAERLKAMDADHVDVSVLYPAVAGLAGETFGRLTDPELELACVQAYNDWLVEEWTKTSPRFIAQCLVPLAPEAAVQEIKRAVGKGHRGVVFPAVPEDLREGVEHINEASYDQIWATCQELEVPVCFHAGASSKRQFPVPSQLSPGLADAMRALTRPVSSIPVLANLLFSRILLRFPNLKFVLAETSLSWGAFELELAEHQFERQRLHLDGYDLTPSEMFRRQCYLTGWYDRAGIEARNFLGTESIMWETNFPHASSTWPDSWQQIERSFDGVPAEDRDKVLAGNASKLYKL